MPEVGSSLLRRVTQLPTLGLLAAVRLYQRGVSPVLPAVFGPNCGCRFAPTCSHYAAEAIRTRGALVGLALTLWRLLRCTPLSAGGLDPVPPPSPSLRRAGLSRHRPTCARVGVGAS